MKKIFKIAFGFIAAIVLMTSCGDDDKSALDFSISSSEITVGAEGGKEKVTISSETEWTAVSDQPWVSVLTASGIGVKECEIAVDTTLIEGIREAKIRIMNTDGEVKFINVHQTGFGNVISLEKEEVNIEASADMGSRYFDINVTTNVAFSVNIDDQARKWLSVDMFKFENDMKKRPKTMKLRFRWEMNSNSEIRETNVSFTTNDGSEIEKPALLKIIQAAAPKITDDRSGDSLVVLTMLQKLGINMEIDPSENMRNWELVTLWEKKDGVPSEWIGRVRSAEFTMINTKEDIPSEVAHLKYVESLTFYGNSNRQLYNIELGESLSNLTNLKELNIVSYGLISLPSSLTNLKKLEKLNIGSNNFRSFPSIINKRNFPNLKSLSMGNERRKDYIDLSTVASDKRADYGMVFERRDLVALLNWSSLEKLVLNLNLLEGEIPDMKDECEEWWSGVDINANDTLKDARDVLIGKPKILPKCKSLYLNLNFFTGKIPDWILYHPYLTEWDPFTLVFSQEGTDSNGKKAGFDNEPLNFNYYYEKYPLKRPKLEE